MSREKPPDSKLQSLRNQGCLNRRPEAISDALFGSDDFFDPRDLVQVKYEMLRRVRRDRQTVSQSSTDFGFSRPAFYQAQLAFEREGLPGLVPKKRGPRGGHKLTAEVLEFLKQERAQDDLVRAEVLAGLVAERYGIRVHPRSIERVLGRLKKKLL